MTVSAADSLRLPRLARHLVRHRSGQQVRDESVVVFLRGLGISQWLLLLYPLFMYAIQRRRDADTVAEVDASAMIQVGYTALCGMCVLFRWMKSPRGMRRTLTATPMMWLLGYGLLAVASTGWSDMPKLTLFRSVQLVVFLLLVCDSLALLRTTDALVKLQLCYAVLLGVFWEFGALRYELSFDSLHSSVVPGAIIGAGLVGWMVKGRQWRVLYGVVVLTLLMSTSTAAYLCVLLGAGTAIMLMRGKNAGLGWILVGLAVILVLQFPDEIGRAIFYGKTESNLRTASGRIPVWQELIEDVVSQRPVLGFGFGYGEAYARLYNTRGLRLMHMHNAVMSALINLGAAGAIMLALFWISTFRVARKSTYAVRPALLGAMVAVMVNSMAMESVSAPVSLGWIGHALFFGMIAVATDLAPVRFAQDAVVDRSRRMAGSRPIRRPV